MLITYSRRQFDRATAWHDLIKLSRRPTYSHGTLRFEVRDNGFRKHHDEDFWGWYVARWCLAGDEILLEAPCPAPEADPEIADLYVWDVWIEYDGTRRCGFVLPWLVKSRCHPHDDPACATCQAIGAWSPP